jgi:uncharacterized membrane protein
VVTKMRWMSRRKLLGSIDAARVKSAIQKAERGTSGEIRVSVAAPFWGDAQKAAERAFARLGMDRTRHRNGVLVFVVPSRRRFVILGDTGIHAKVGHAFWERISHALSERFRAGDFTGGLVHGIEAIGEELRAHFPSESKTDTNELADDVDLGGS